jgi:hypothetical protein
MKISKIYSALSLNSEYTRDYRQLSELSLQEIKLPPPYTEWVDELEKWGYYDCFFVGVDTPTGWEIGQVIFPRASFSYTFTCTNAGIGFNHETATLYVADSDKIIESGQIYFDLTVTDSDQDDLSVSTTLYINVVDNNSGIIFASSSVGDNVNSGKQPHIPYYFDVSKAYQLDEYRFKRGDVWDQTFTYNTTTKYSAYGSATKARPRFNYTEGSYINGSGVVNNKDYACHPTILSSGSFKSCTGVEINDMHFSGGIVVMRMVNSPAFITKRCLVSDNIENENSSGLRASDIDNGMTIRFFETKDIYGDGIYGVGLKSKYSLYEIAYSDFDEPYDYQGDSIQITHENDSANWCYNVWIHHNKAKQNLSGSNTKGSVVVEGCSNYLVEHNELPAKYFAIGAAGNNGTIRKNITYYGGLPDTNASQSNSWVVGAGADDIIHELSVYDNSMYNLGTMYTALQIGGYGLSGTNAERYDMNYNANRIFKFPIGFKTTIAWSGDIDDNLMILCPTPTSLQGGVATQGSTLSQNIGMIWTGNRVYDSGFNIELVGDFVDNGVVSAIIPEIAGNVIKVCWRINGEILSYGESLTFTIPTGSSSLLDPRRPSVNGINTPELSCFAIIKSSQGDYDIIHSDYISLV